MSNTSSVEVDHFGFPLDISSLYDDKYPPPPRRCGCCRQVGHDRRNCPAIFSAAQPCLIRATFGGGEFGGEGRLNCLCMNCIEYRKYNYPTPEKAAWRLRKLEEERKRKYPSTKVYNMTDDKIYIYEFNGYGIMELVDWIEEEKSSDFQLSRGLDRGEVANLVVTSRNFGEDNIHYEHINPRYIVESITVEYGESFEYDIHDSKDSYMKQLEKDKKQWMNAGLKLKYLLEQLDRLGASGNPNLECIMDMVQDVDIPEHGDFDKDDAGVPSVFTNTVGITDIDPPSDSESDLEDIPDGIPVNESRLGLRLADFIHSRSIGRAVLPRTYYSELVVDVINHYNRE